MTSLEKKEEIKKTTTEFFEKLTIPINDLKVNIIEKESVQESDQNRESVVEIKIRVDDPQILIGERGLTLNEIQRLLGIILNRKAEKKFYVNIDINEYKEKKIDYLKNIAKEIADEVSFTKKEKTLPPMSSYERRIIHTELADYPGVSTESQGEGPDRRVVIKPS